MKSALRLTIVFALLSVFALAQSPNATIAGRVLDPSNAVLSDAKVEAINLYTNIHYAGQTNREGSFAIPNLPPGPYRIEVSKSGFKTGVREDVVLRVQDIIALNFTLSIGSVTESVTVTGGAPLVDTESAAVSTVVDRNFAENLPLNGRSFQTLIDLTPGVVPTANNGNDTGQFSVNGQRASSNYWSLDGVSANIGITAIRAPSNGLGGALGSFSVLGGTNSLVSVDALQEFRIQTSTYAPEFGRTPGAQISIVTRSGTNQFHGTAFDYLRNDVLDANDWFADNRGLPKPRERQNDFGGTLGGPILKDRTFFFFSYEGLRLRLPQVALTNVRDVAARLSAVPAMQPFLNAYPLPNGMDNAATGVAQFNASFSNPATLDAYSLRVDHKLSAKLSIFGRYNYSPSQLQARGAGFNALSDVGTLRITTQTATTGATWVTSPIASNDFRFNYSRTNSSDITQMDNFGGAVPLTSIPFPAGFSTDNAVFAVTIASLGLNSGRGLSIGTNTLNIQQQINVVDSVSVQEGSHALKFGVDFRRLSPEIGGFQYGQNGVFGTVSAADTGNTAFTILESARDVTFSFRNLGIFAQDTWRAAPRLTLTYGLRWDVDFAPSSISGPGFSSFSGFNLGNLSTLALAPLGTAPYKTTFDNFAPRIGLAYVVTQNQKWQAVVRGGFGLFYDLASSEAGNVLPIVFYPNGAFVRKFGATFPLSGGAEAPPPIIAPSAASPGSIFGFDPNLELPYTLEWNVALEQALGREQSISATYIGASGKRLLQTAFVSPFPNPNFTDAQLTTNAGTSNYNALQLQFQRRLSHGLQVLASYSWSHSIDTASAGSLGNLSNALSVLNSSVNRGSSDFDIRNAFSAGVTYEVPTPKITPFANAILRGWSFENVVQARSALPVDLSDSNFQLLNGALTNVRPDVSPGIPLYLFGPQFPGGRALNNTAGAVAGGCPADGSPSVGPFCPPPYDPNTFIPSRQGNLGRNTLRGFGAVQWDFAVHRDFPIHESLKLQFRAEMFNVLNHPNFGPPIGDIADSRFGQSTQMLGQSLSGTFGLGGGAFNPLYQIGGPRSIQLALKLQF